MEREIPKKIILARILITLILSLLISSGFSVATHIGEYILYYIPFLLIYILVFVWIDLVDDYVPGCCTMTYMLITTFVNLPIFLGIYFGIFYPIFSFNAEKIENCQVIGMAPMNQASFEVYVILYVDFQYKGENYLGYACGSDQQQNLNAYRFLDKGNAIICDEAGDSFQDDSRILLQNNSSILGNPNQRKRLLKRKRGDCDKSGDQPLSSYNFSYVKLPSWMCIDKDMPYEELIKPKTCYITFIDDEHTAIKNSKARDNLKEVYHFALTQFEYPGFFPKAGFICLILFTLLPFLANIYPLSVIITIVIYLKLTSLYRRIDKTFTT